MKKSFLNIIKRTSVWLLVIMLLGNNLAPAQTAFATELAEGIEEQTEPEASTEEQTEPELNGEEQIEPEVTGEEQTEPELNGEEQMESEVTGEEQTEPELNGEEQMESEAAGEEQTESGLVIDWFVDLGTIETTAGAFYGLADGVSLVGTAEKWIDRIDLSGEAAAVRSFYDLLEEASDNDGYNDYLIEDQYYTEDSFYIEVLTVDGELYSNNKDKITTYAKAALNAFDRDHPEVFWLSGSSLLGAGEYPNGERVVILYLKYENGETSFDIRDSAYEGASTYEKEANIKAGICKVEEYVGEYMAAVSDMTTVEKIKYFNRQLTMTNQYSTGSDLSNIHHECRECISALEGRVGEVGPVCEAYARAFKLLCDNAGIPCVLVDGPAITAGGGSGGHMWNYVEVDDNWYGVDVTWNDPSVSGVTGAVSGAEREDYLLVGSATKPKSHTLTFIDSHPVENCAYAGGVAFVNGPELSATAHSSMMSSFAPSGLTLLKDDETEIVITNSDGTTTDCTANGVAGEGTWSYENGVLTLNNTTDLGEILWGGGNLTIALSGVNTGCSEILYMGAETGTVTIQGPGTLVAETIKCILGTLDVSVRDCHVVLDNYTLGSVGMSDAIITVGGSSTVKGEVTLAAELTIANGEVIKFIGDSYITNPGMLTVEEGAIVKVDDEIHTHSVSTGYTVLPDKDKMHLKVDSCVGCPLRHTVATEEACTLEELDGTNKTYCIYCMTEYGEEAPVDPDYVGDYGIGYTVATSDIKGFTGDVVFTVKYHTVQDEAYEYPNFGMYRGTDTSNPEDYDKYFFDKEHFTFIETEINEWHMIDSPATDSEIVVILSKEAVAELEVDEIIFPVWGVVIEDVIISQTPITYAEVSLDEEYPAVDDWGNVVSAVIPAATLVQFEGPVAVTVDYKTTGAAEYPSFRAVTADWGDLNPKGNVTTYENEGTVTFVLSEEDVAAAVSDGGVMFHLNELWITQAILTVPTADDYYVGDWNIAYTFTNEELAGLNGDITITGEYTTIEAEEGDDWYAVQFTDLSGWTNLTADDFVDGYRITEDDCINLTKNGTSFHITLKAETLERLIANGGDLAIRVYHVIVQDATLTVYQQDTIVLDSAYPEEDESGTARSAIIPAEEFVGFEGPVAITLDYVKSGTVEWPSFEAVTPAESSLKPRGNVTVQEEEGTITFVLSEEDVAKVMAEGGIRFLLRGVYFTQASLREATPDDYYVGDWNIGHTFTAAEIAELSGDITITGEYTTIATEEGDNWYAVGFTDLSNWSPLAADDFVDGYRITEENCIDLTKNGTSFNITVKAQTWERLIANGGDLGIQVRNVIVQSATLTVSQQNTVALDSSYPVADENGDVLSAIIPADALEAFDGPVAITLNYVKTGEVDWPYFEAVTTEGNGLEMDGNTSIGNEEEGTNTIVISEEGVATAIMEGGIRFRLDGVYFTQAIITTATADDYYKGDYNLGYLLNLSKLVGVTEEVTFTMEYTTVSTGYDWPFIQLINADTWESFYTEDFADDTETNEYGCIGVDIHESEMTLTIKAESIAELIAAGADLGIQVYGVIVQEASLEAPGFTGNIIVDDTTNPNGLVFIHIPTGIPEDGQVHLMTYEIYDENGIPVGFVEYRACSEEDTASAWITAHGVEDSVLLYDNGQGLREPRMILMSDWDFGEEDYRVYSQYTYRVIGNKVLSEKISGVQNLIWDSTKTPGWIKWEPVEGASGYKVSVIRREDDSAVFGGMLPASYTEMNVADRINESGTYFVRILTYGGKDTLNSDEIELPAEYVYTRPETEVGVTNKVWWTIAEGKDIPTVANWTPVVGAKGYEMWIRAYDAENPDGASVSGVGYTEYNTEDRLLTSWDFEWNINNLNAEAAQAGKTYIYKVEIRALSGNIELLANARDEDTFVSSGEYKTREAIEEEVKTRIAEELAGGNNISTVIDSMGKDEFGDAMKNNRELQQLMKEAEDNTNVTVKDPEVERALGIDPSTVRVVGAAMNAQSGTVGLVMKSADERIEVNRELYHNATQMDISLKHEGASGSTIIRELDVPMLVTIPAPANIDPERMVILHEHGGETEILYPVYNEEDGTISFSVTSFSTFAFAGINLYNEVGGAEVIEPVEPETLPDVRRVTLDLGSKIGIYYWYLKSELQADEGAYAVIEINGRKEVVPMEKWTEGDYSSANDAHKIAYMNVYAKEMRDTISITVYDRNGRAISKTKDFTIGKTIAVTYRDNADEDLRNLCIEMLCYGAAAQKVLTYKTDDLATKYFEEYPSIFGDIDRAKVASYLNESMISMDANAYGEGVAIADALPDVRRVSLDLGSAIGVYYWYLKSELQADEGAYAVIEINGRKEIVPMEKWTTGDYSSANDAYKIAYMNVYAKEMRDRITITVYDRNGTAISKTKEFTVGKTIAVTYRDNSNEDLRELCRQMLYYGAAAQKVLVYNVGDLATKYFDEYPNIFGGSN